VPIVFNPGAFKQKPGLFDALGDAGTAAGQASGMMVEAMLAKAKLEGWKEARENDKRRLAIAEQDQAFQVQDRDAAMQTAEAGSQFRGFQAKPSPAESVGLMPPGTGVDPSEEDENAEVQRIATEVTKDPRARMAFLEDVKAGRQEKAIQDGLQSVKGKLQDRLAGIGGNEHAMAFAPDFERLVAELDQIQPGMDPKLVASIIDDIGRRADGYSKEMYETALWKGKQQQALDMIAGMRETLPPGHPMHDKLAIAELGVALGDVDDFDSVMRALNAEQLGFQEVEPGLFEDPMTYRREQRLAGDSAARRAQADRGLDLREREVTRREGGGTMTGKREPSMADVTRETNAIYEAWQAEGVDGEEGHTRDDAHRIAQRRAVEHKSGKVTPGKVPGGVAGMTKGGVTNKKSSGKSAAKADPFLDAMTPEKRAEFEAKSPELQKRIREKAGG
jgi:hypothetical protein